MADNSTMTLSVLRRPIRSDSQPERMRPEAFPVDVTTSEIVATVAPSPAARAKGTSWLIVIWPAVVPRQ